MRGGMAGDGARVERSRHPERHELAEEVVLHAARNNLARQAERAARAPHGRTAGAVRRGEDRSHEEQPANCVEGVRAAREGGARCMHARVRALGLEEARARAERKRARESDGLCRVGDRVGAALVGGRDRVEQHRAERKKRERELGRAAEHRRVRPREPERECLVARQAEPHEQRADHHAALHVGGRGGGCDKARAADARGPEERGRVAQHGCGRVRLRPEVGAPKMVAEDEEGEANRVHRSNGRPGKVAVPALVGGRQRGRVAAEVHVRPRQRERNLEHVAHDDGRREEEDERARERRAAL
mmetsp:Transcript_6788/g.21442  ORF Transcript_6788/g.21442 Transcript_6788/m.21442 type:complete len:302 (-) Transcript_6788:273-1178(-)